MGLLSAGVDIAEVIDLPRPSLAAEGVANLRPPNDFGLLDHGDRAFVRALLLTRAVAGAGGNVLLVCDAVDPDLPVAARQVTQQINRLARRHSGVSASHHDLTLRRRPSNLRRRHDAG